LQEINDMVDEAVRLRTAETESDKLGPTAATKSQHGAGAAAPNKAFQPAQTPEQHETELFARSVAAFLLKGHQEGRFQKLILVVSPHFLGVLRKQLDPGLEPLVKLEINKDYTHCNGEELREHIQAHQAKK
jgi:protein required for attachment to host cells